MVEPVSGRLSRRELIASALPIVAGGCATSRRPNILFAIADDMSFPHAGAYGDKAVRTPNFDRVAREGVLFSNSFSNCPSCTPSRSAILTGRPMWQLEEAGVLYGSLPKKLSLYTDLLAAAGYHVGFTGKGWSPGDWRAGGRTTHPNGQEFNSRLFRETLPAGIDKRDYAANFSDFLSQRPDGAPFCFWFGCTEPHRVYEKGIGRKSGKRLEDVRVPPFLPDTEEIRSDLLDYYFEVEWFDRQLGGILARIEKAGELDRTMVVVTSDNGMPFPRAKVNLYDWGVHMPLAIRWGDRLAKPGRIAREMVSHIDFAPTFLQAAGVAPPVSMEGRSLLPLLYSSAPDRSRDAVYSALERHTMCRPEGATYPCRAIRTRDYLYIRNFAPDRWPTGGEFLSSNKTTHGDVDACPSKTYMLSDQARADHPDLYGLAFGQRPPEELYDVATDPGQIRNVASDAAYRRSRESLSRRLDAYLKQTGDPRIAGRDPWQSYIYHQTTGYGASFNLSLPEVERRAARERDTHKPE